MNVFWETVIAPVLNILKPQAVVEIGADEGSTTRQILSYCRETGAFAHIIDPQPKFDPAEFRRSFGEIFHFYRELSLQALPLIKRMDVVLIDGDHNWYTVYNELKLIENISYANQAVFPLIFLHDISWPYGRRDLYYNPENIPSAYLHPYARKGLEPNCSRVGGHGGLNPHLFNAVYENSPKNGVLTAVEDFMEGAETKLELVKIPAFNGLGLLFCSELFDNPDFSEFIHKLVFSQLGFRLLSELESSRVKVMADLEATRQQLWALEKEKARKIDELKTLEQNLRTNLKRQKDRIKEIEDTIKRQQSQIEALDQANAEKDRQINALEETRQKESAKYKRENEQLVHWMRQLREQFIRLMRSRRWRLGHGLVSILTLSILRKNVRMATDHIRRIFSEFEALKDGTRGGDTLGFPKQLSDSDKDPTGAGGLDLVFFWKQNDTGIYGRRMDMLVKYLSKRPEIRKIAVFDMPIATGELDDKAAQPPLSHDRLVYEETLFKNQGGRDKEKVSYQTFIYRKNREGIEKKIWRTPKKRDYIEYIGDRLRARGVQAEDAVFWFYPENPYIKEIVKTFQPGAVVVDLVDDHRTWPGISLIRKLWLNRHYREALARADIAITNCRNIQQAMHDLHPNIEIIPNACDMEPPPDQSGESAFAAFKKIPRPRIGYVGNLEKGKIDADLIHYIAGSHPEWQLLLIGSTHTGQHVTELHRHENIHFIGIVPYPEIKAWIREFDVAIIPHLDSPQTRSMNPLKLYVYCSLGVPVVATDIANIDEFRNVISVAGSHADFVASVEDALQQSTEKIPGEIQSYLDENTWEKRIDRIIEMLAAHMAFQRVGSC